MSSRRQFGRFCLSALLCAPAFRLAQADPLIEGSGNIVVSAPRAAGPGQGAVVVSMSGPEACELKLVVTPSAK